MWQERKHDEHVDVSKKGGNEADLQIKTGNSHLLSLEGVESDRGSVCVCVCVCVCCVVCVFSVGKGGGVSVDVGWFAPIAAGTKRKQT